MDSETELTDNKELKRKLFTSNGNVYMEKTETTCEKFPFDTFKEGFLTQIRAKEYQNDSIRTYGKSIECFLNWLSGKKVDRIQNVTSDMLESYRNYLSRKKYKPYTVDLRVRVLRYFFSYLEESGEIFINPAFDLRTPKPERHLQYVPSVEEIDKLISVIDTDTHIGIRDRAIIETAYSCALRKSELQSLKVNSIDFKNEVLRVFGKGRKERLVPLTSEAIYYLYRYLKEVREVFIQCESDYLWIGKTLGTPLSKVAFQKIIEDYSERTKVKISFHSIRRACATHMLRNGASPMDIQQLLGHADLKTLGQYLKVSIVDLKKMHERSIVGQ